MKKVSAIIVAAGEGKRFGCLKQFALLKGKPILDWCLEEFETHEQVNEIILVLPDIKEKTRFYSLYKKIVAVIQGGEKRQDSVFKGFSLIDPSRTEIVLVHDGVRPLIEKDLISRIITDTWKTGAAIPTIPLEETLKEISEKKVIRTLERNHFCRVQTPQGFFYPILKKAFEKAFNENFYGNDEAVLVERMGGEVGIVRGDQKNIKITTPVDLKIAEALLEN